MTQDDPILSAPTVAAFMMAVNQQYQLNLSAEFEQDIPLAQMWEMEVEVIKGNSDDFLYKATANLASTFAPGLDGKVFITVIDDDG